MLSLILFTYSPFSLFGKSTINATVESVQDGEAKITMYDYPWLHNAFNSIHAVATANLAEMTAGLAATSALQKVDMARGIPLSQTTSWFKKAQGQLTGTAVTTIPKTTGRHDVQVVVVIRDEQDDIVCESTVVWRIQIKGTGTGRSKGKKGY